MAFLGLLFDYYEFKMVFEYYSMSFLNEKIYLLGLSYQRIFISILENAFHYVKYLFKFQFNFSSKLKQAFPPKPNYQQQCNKAK
jgi:hypothetical protein